MDLVFVLICSFYLLIRSFSPFTIEATVLILIGMYSCHFDDFFLVILSFLCFLLLCSFFAI